MGVLSGSISRYDRNFHAMSSVFDITDCIGVSGRTCALRSNHIPMAPDTLKGPWRRSTNGVHIGTADVRLQRGDIFQSHLPSQWAVISSARHVVMVVLRHREDHRSPLLLLCIVSDTFVLSTDPNGRCRCSAIHHIDTSRIGAICFHFGIR